MGGIHGLAILVSRSLQEKFYEVSNTCAETVLWIRLDAQVLGFDLIIGAVYIPHEALKHHAFNMFDDIITDCIAIKALYDAPFCLIGDFNLRTGMISDYVDLGDFASVAAGLDASYNGMNPREDLNALRICTQRFNLDRVSNNNGRGLVDLCRSLDIHIVNGRFGSDQGVGNFTFADKSTIDYVIVSPEIFPNIVNFEIDACEKTYVR